MCSYLLSDISHCPSVPQTEQANVSKNQKTKNKSYNNNINKQSKHNKLHNYDIFLTNLQVTTINLFISNKDQCHSPFLFFSLWRQEWLMTTQEVWFNYRKSSFPYHSCLQELLGLSGGTSHCYSSDTVLLIVITKRWVAVSIPGNTIFS